MSKNRPKRIYLDYAATTPIDPRVLREMNFHLKNTFGNTESIYEEGVEAKKILEKSRREIAGFLSARPEEVVFTSGGTESNNLAISGLIAKLFDNENKELRVKNGKGLHVITSLIEHSSVLKCFKECEKKGIEVTYLPVDKTGIVDLALLKKALRPETVLVSIQYANNEIGTIQPIREIAKILRSYRKSGIKNYELRIKENNNVKNQFPFFHCDASQAPAYLDCNVERIGVDLLTLDGHKIYGPKGVGALYVRKGTKIAPILFGGRQEKGQRPGTVNVPLIAGLGKAVMLCHKERDKENKRIISLRNFLVEEMSKILGKEAFNGGLNCRLPNNINISLKEKDTEFLVLELDAAGISVSTKSACLGDDEGSYVVAALGGEKWRKDHTLRITLGRFTTSSDCKNFLKIFFKILKKKVN